MSLCVHHRGHRSDPWSCMGQSKKKPTNMENRGCQRAVPLTGCLTRKRLLFIWGIKVLGFSLEAHLENLWVEPYDAWDLLQSHVRVGWCMDSQGFVFSVWCR